MLISLFYLHIIIFFSFWSCMVDSIQKPFLSAPRTLRDWLCSVRQSVPEVRDLAKVLRPQKLWTPISRPKNDRFFLNLRISSGRVFLSTKTFIRKLILEPLHTRVKCDFFLWGHLTPKGGPWVPVGWVGFVGPKEYQLLTKDVRQNSTSFSRYSGSKFFLLPPIASQPLKCQRPNSVTW